MSERVVPRVQQGLQRILLIFQLFLLISGIVLLCFDLWLLLDPSRSFFLRLVHFSVSWPHLQLAVYLLLGTSFAVFVAVAVGFSGIMKLERCLISGFIALLVLLLHSKLVILLFIIFFRIKFPNESAMTSYLSNIAQKSYWYDKWATPLMDSIQFYQQCCGGSGARDYLESYWYKTNNERGTTSFVPWSCCRQTQNGRAWDLEPIDPLCIQYEYGSSAFNDSVNFTGCGVPSYQHLNWLLHLFVAVLVVTTLLDAFGLFLAVKCLCQVLTFYRTALK